MTFNTTKLADGRVLITGTDRFGTSGRTTVDGGEWDQFSAKSALNQAHEAFDETVRNFFAPITEAAEKLEQAHKLETDPLFYIVEREGEAPTAGVAEVVTRLSKDSAVLRLIEQDPSSPRLIWITDTELEILAATEVGTATAPTTVVTEGTNAAE